MPRDPILGLLDRDIACAIALGVVESPLVTITPEAVGIIDPRTRATRTLAGWLDGSDPLDVAVREFLQARKDAMRAAPSGAGGAWSSASTIKNRDAANQKAIAAKNRALAFVKERNVVQSARLAGFRVMG